MVPLCPWATVLKHSLPGTPDRAPETLILGAGGVGGSGSDLEADSYSSPMGLPGLMSERKLTPFAVSGARRAFRPW